MVQNTCINIHFFTKIIEIYNLSCIIVSREILFPYRIKFKGGELCLIPKEEH